MPAARAGPPPAAPRPPGGVAGPCPACARRTAATDEHQKVDAAADLPCWRRGLIHHRREAEQVEIHGHCIRVAGRDREVTGVLQRDQSRLGRSLGDGAHIAQRTAAAAVAGVVQLEDHAARIGGKQIARAAIRRSAFVLPADANEGLLRSWFRCGRWCGGEAMSGERPHRAIDREALHAESKRADARTFAVRCLPQRKESRSVADPEQDCRTLPRLHRHSEQALVELERSPDVGDRQRDLTESVHSERRARLGLRGDSRRHGQRGKRGEKVTTIDRCSHAGILCCSIHGEAIEQAGAAGHAQVLLAAAA